NQNGIRRYPWIRASRRISGEGELLMNIDPSGHWTRVIAMPSTADKMYVGIGSMTSISPVGVYRRKRGVMRSVMKTLTINPAGTEIRGSDGTGMIFASLLADDVANGAGRSVTLIKIGFGIKVTFVVPI
ncbi:unnamed protein product, partial [Didymodactylos carnosus]